MSVMHATIKKVNSGTTKKGGPMQGLLCIDEAGAENWYNYFGNKTATEGATIVAEMAAFNDGSPFIQEFSQSDGPPNNQPQGVHNAGDTYKAPQVANSQPVAASSEEAMWRIKDLKVSAGFAFTAIMSTALRANHEIEPLAKIAFKCATYWDRAARSHVAGADMGALKQSLQAPQHEQPQATHNPDTAAVGRDGGGAVQPDVPPHQGQPTDEFDDDIPF